MSTRARRGVANTALPTPRACADQPAELQGQHAGAWRLIGRLRQSRGPLRHPSASTALRPPAQVLKAVRTGVRHRRRSTQEGSPGTDAWANWFVSARGVHAGPACFTYRARTASRATGPDASREGFRAFPQQRLVHRPPISPAPFAPHCLAGATPRVGRDCDWLARGVPKNGVRRLRDRGDQETLPASAGRAPPAFRRLAANLRPADRVEPSWAPLAPDSGESLRN